jgi:hypothetical protein
MWLATTIGFFSIVEKPWDRPARTLTVRTRAKVDLDGFRRYCPELGEQVEADDADYRFRAQAPKEAVANALLRLTADIDYDNFKDAVASRQGSQRAAIYSKVWHALYAIQSSTR